MKEPTPDFLDIVLNDSALDALRMKHDKSSTLEPVLNEFIEPQKMKAQQVNDQQLKIKKRNARIKRLLRSSFVFFARPDDTWAESILPKPEYGVYIRMDPRDREHAVRVAKVLLERQPKANQLVVRGALLHDCGKLVRPYRLLERIWLGWNIKDPITDELLAARELARAETLSAADVRRYHPQIGAWLIRAAGGHERVALIVEHHHHPRGDKEIMWVHDIDDLE